MFSGYHELPTEIKSRLIVQSSRLGPGGYLPALPYLESPKQLPSATTENPSNGLVTLKGLVTVGVTLFTTLCFVYFYYQVSVEECKMFLIKKKFQ